MSSKTLYHQIALSFYLLKWFFIWSSPYFILWKKKLYKEITSFFVHCIYEGVTIWVVHYFKQGLRYNGINRHFEEQKRKCCAPGKRDSSI